MQAQTSIAAERPYSDSSELARAKTKEGRAFTQPVEANSLESQTTSGKEQVGLRKGLFVSRT